jgi:PAS domain S-box-containing protein
MSSVEQGAEITNTAVTPLGQVLVVDDEVELKNSLVQLLNTHGYQAVGYGNGEEALTALSTHTFDVMLTDLIMPGIDGISLLQASLEFDPHLVCIVMTGQETIPAAVDAMQVGAFDYVLKPFRLQTILPILMRAMNTRRLKLENLQLRETVALYEVSQTIAFTLDPQMVISKLADAALQETDADEVSILLPTSDGKELYIAAVRGANRQRLLGERVPLENSITSWVARERASLILVGEVDDDRFRALWPRPEISSAISVPMQVGNKLVGTINLNSISRHRSFSPRQMKALTILAGTAAAALETASLYTKVQQAEESYRSIFENAIEGIFQTALDGRFIRANPAMAQMLGYGTPGKLIAAVEDVRQELYVDPSRLEEFARLLEENDRLSAFEIQLRKRDGSSIFLSESARAVRDDSGAVLYYEGIAEDITERKRAEEEEARLRLEIEQQRLRIDAIVATVPGVVFEAWEFGKETHRTEFVSEYIKSMTGYSVEEWKSEPGFWLSILHPDDEERVKREAAEQLATGKSETLEFRWIAKDGSVVWVSAQTIGFRDENGNVSGVRGVVTDITERKRAENRLAAQHAVTSALANSSTLMEGALKILQAICESLGWVWGALWTVDRSRNVLRCNELWHAPSIEAKEFEAISRASVYGPGVGLPGRVWSDAKPFWIPEVPGDANFPRDAIAAKEKLHSGCGFPIRLGSEVLGVMEFFSQSIPEPDKDLLAMMATIGSQIGQFIERKGAEERLRSSEEQLLQSQKLEAIGQLAGGVAHDFNNLLTVIAGYSSILLGRIPKDSPHRIPIEEIKKASDRASGLTRQLLAFSRKQILQPKLLDLNEVLTNLEKMVRRLIGEDIDLFTITDPSLGKVKADPGQIEQVLLNLIVNARDAMPQGGKLTIETANVILSDEHAQRYATTSGAYAMFAVSDSGCGMDSEIREHIFEPFFTTKGAGKGTGLGLSTVYGIVKQSGGHVWLYSEPNKGTTFKVYLPLANEAQEQQEIRMGTRAIPKGTETLLLVEDEDSVRSILTDILETQGYHVIVASNGMEALKIAATDNVTIHLMVTDVVMPQMSGRELAEQVTKIRPDMKILYMSGYTDDAIVRHGLLDEKLNFLQKPFDSAAVARKVRQVLDSQQ